MEKNHEREAYERLQEKKTEINNRLDRYYQDRSNVIEELLSQENPEFEEFSRVLLLKIREIQEKIKEKKD